MAHHSQWCTPRRNSKCYWVSDFQTQQRMLYGGVGRWMFRLELRKAKSRGAALQNSHPLQPQDEGGRSANHTESWPET
jgi:hypothetical protein